MYRVNKIGGLMMIDYKKAYEELKDYVINLKPYCNNCGTKMDDCDDCHRKYFNWTCDVNSLPKLKDK